jgi:hypothetical protein
MMTCLQVLDVFLNESLHQINMDNCTRPLSVLPFVLNVLSIVIAVLGAVMAIANAKCLRTRVPSVEFEAQATTCTRIE